MKKSLILEICSISTFALVFSPTRYFLYNGLFLALIQQFFKYRKYFWKSFCNPFTLNGNSVMCGKKRRSSRIMQSGNFISFFCAELSKAEFMKTLKVRVMAYGVRGTRRMWVFSKYLERFEAEPHQAMQKRFLTVEVRSASWPLGI